MRALLLIGLWLWGGSACAAAQPDPFPQVAAAYLVELDGKPLWARQPDRRLPQASLTKLMTVLLALEQGRMDDVVTIGNSAARETGSLLHLKAGQQFRLHDLLAAAMLPSANDACHALADHLAGNQAAFVARMNRRAALLGLHDTHFVNACGHDSPGHYSSAHDLALLAHAVLHHPAVPDLSAQAHLTISTVDGNTHFQLDNKNALIGRYPGALGLKTGYTLQAGKCLVAYAKRDTHEVLLVMLHGKDRWWDSADMLDLAFDHARIAH